MPTAGSRLAGEHEYAFKHVLIRDVAYSTLPKSVRARHHAEVGAFIEERAADRSEGVVAMVADHYGRAAALGADAGLDAPELERIGTKAAEALEAAGDAAAALYSNQEALDPLRDRAVAGARPRRRRARARSPRSSATSPCGSGGWTRPSRSGRGASDFHRREEDLQRVGDLHRKIGAALWHKGDREGSIEHYQRGIDLLKDGPPCLELVRLYEEAASLYMHTGDNMLAIYASEKALRLAERLGEAAAASRAHGIFGRVFGRIGDSERAARTSSARSSWRASPTPPRLCARCSPSATTSRSRRPTTTRPGPPTGGARAGRADRRPALPGRAPRGARPARGAPRRLGHRRERDRGLGRAGRARGPDRQALLPLRDAGHAALARGRLRRRRRAAHARRRAGRAGRPLRGRLPGALLAGGVAAPAGKLRRGRHRALARARHLRARRPGRAVGGGDLRPRDHADAGRAAPTPRARRPRRPGASPSACATRSARPPASRPPAPSPTTTRRERTPSRPPGPPGWSWAARSTRPAASTSGGCCCERTIPRPRRRPWNGPRRRPQRHGIDHLAGLARGALQT